MFLCRRRLPLVTKVYLGSDPHFLRLTRANAASIALEQRVAHPASDAQRGRTARTVTINVVTRATPADASRYAGTWTDAFGLVELVSNGGRFLATEHPTTRLAS